MELKRIERLKEWAHLTASQRSRLRKQGVPIPRMKPGHAPLDFDAMYERGDGCWLWRGVVNRDGYGTFTVDYKPLLAHRYAWERANGQSAKGHVVMHSCDTPGCVNPAHLRLGTHSENAKDRHRKGRSARGERGGNARLTEAQVKEIRARYVPKVVTQKMLAAEYGVSRDLVLKIINRRLWTHA